MEQKQYEKSILQETVKICLEIGKMWSNGYYSKSRLKLKKYYNALCKAAINAAIEGYTGNTITAAQQHVWATIQIFEHFEESRLKRERIKAIYIGVNPDAWIDLNNAIDLDYPEEIIQRMRVNVFGGNGEMKPTQRAVMYALLYKERYENKSVINTIPDLAKEFGLSEKKMKGNYREVSNKTDTKVYQDASNATTNKKSLNERMKSVSGAIELLEKWKCDKAVTQAKKDLNDLNKLILKK